MLSHLSIRNIVLIEKTDIDFSKGLCVLTGETGAGKSILLDALGLVMGGRAEAKLVRAGEEKALVSATFELVELGEELAKQLEDNGIELEDGQLMIRRQLTSDGKSKAFINDVAVSAKMLKVIGELLVEIHGQHQQRGLMDEALHGDFLDAYGEVATIKTKVASAYGEWHKARSELKKLTDMIEQASRDREYLEHMQAELQQLSPEEGEEEHLSDERLRMMQAEKMAATLDDALKELSQPKDVYEGLRSAQSTLSRSTLQEASRFSPAIEALEKALIEVEEARVVLEDIGRSTGYDQYELEKIEERLFALKDAGRKYKLSVDELPTLYREVTEKLATLEGQEYQLAGLEQAVKETRAAYFEVAEKLRDKRKKVASKLEKSMHTELTPLKMQATRFQVLVEEKPESAWDKSGADTIRFEVATNKGTDFGALAAIASGGELSRFMLALAVVLAGTRGTPTMIFDEIDTGTGGAVADAIGGRLQLLGKGAQVLVVTHLPQVAARGAQHLFIEKSERANSTITEVKGLSDTERSEELARMISGAEVTEEARKAALKLVEAAA